MTGSEELHDRMQQQLEEAMSEKNRYFAGEVLHRPPTDEEAMRHYIRNGGAKGFAERYNKRLQTAEHN